MRRNSKSKNELGFTLVELMVVVAIIGLLAAIAIPQFRNFQLKALRTEGLIMLRTVHTAETAYYAANDTFLIPTPDDVATANLVLVQLGLPELQFPTTKSSYSVETWTPEVPLSGIARGFFLMISANLDQADTDNDILAIHNTDNPAYLAIGPKGVPIIVLSDF